MERNTFTYLFDQIKLFNILVHHNKHTVVFG